MRLSPDRAAPRIDLSSSARRERPTPVGADSRAAARPRGTPSGAVPEFQVMRLRQHLPALSIAAAAALPCAAAFAGDATESTAVLAQGRWRIEGTIEAPRDGTSRDAHPRVLRLGAEGGLALHAEHGGVSLERLDEPGAAPSASD